MVGSRFLIASSAIRLLLATNKAPQWRRTAIWRVRSQHHGWPNRIAHLPRTFPNQVKPHYAKSLRLQPQRRILIKTCWKLLLAFSPDSLDVRLQAQNPVWRGLPVLADLKTGNLCLSNILGRSVTINIRKELYQRPQPWRIMTPTRHRCPVYRLSRLPHAGGPHGTSVLLRM